MLQLLEVFDTLDSVRVNAKSVVTNDLHAFQLVCSQLHGILEKNGVQRIDAIGKPFNPDIHEAAEMISSHIAAGSVVQEMRKGYLMRGEVLRAALVQVSG